MAFSFWKAYEERSSSPKAWAKIDVLTMKVDTSHFENYKKQLATR